MVDGCRGGLLFSFSVHDARRHLLPKIGTRCGNSSSSDVNISFATEGKPHGDTVVRIKRSGQTIPWCEEGRYVTGISTVDGMVRRFVGLSCVLYAASYSTT
jgi:hypothetical protein